MLLTICVFVLAPYFGLGLLLLIYCIHTAPLSTEEVAGQLTFHEQRLVHGIRRAAARDAGGRVG